MRIISFAHTTPAVLIGAHPDPRVRALAKTCTRRRWDTDYANSFYAGEVLQGYDRSQRIGGHRVSIIKLTAKPYLASTADMPDSDYRAEGFEFLFTHPELLVYKGKQWPCKREDFSIAGFKAWQARSELLYVVRFQLLSVEKGVKVVY